MTRRVRSAGARSINIVLEEKSRGTETFWTEQSTARRAKARGAPESISAAAERKDRLEAHMQALLEGWHLAPVVKALMGFRGYQTVAAMITVSEIGDIHRFAHPRQLMAYLGLVPTALP